MNRRGFTLVELLVALVLVGVVTGSIYQLLLNNNRVYRQQSQRVDLNADLRAAVALLPGELREVAATDTAESDLLGISAAAITFKAMRTLHILCQNPSGSGTSGSIVTWANPQYGLRALDAARDSILLFAEADTLTRMDNYWAHANVRGTSTGTACPGGAASLTISLTDISPAGALDDMDKGAPARGFVAEQVLTYADDQGDVWLGLREYRKGSGWPTTAQPLLGPLAASGLRFSFFDSTGAATTTPERVFSIGLTIIGSTAEPVRASDGTMRRVTDSLTTRVAIRNNRW